MGMKFEAGQTVYSETGEQAEYVAQAGDGHVVRPIVEACGYDGEDSYEHVCEPTMWRNVFAEPPVSKFSAELKSLHAQIEQARTLRREQDNEDHQRQRERAAAFKQFAELDNLQAFIEGKITHYVEHHSYAPPKIVSVEQAKAEGSGDWRYNLRLLTLNANLRDGKVSWTTNTRSDGGGNEHSVTPCTSLEQANELAKKSIVRHFAHDSRDARGDWIIAAEQCGVAVPEEYRRKVAAAKLNQLESSGEYNRRQAIAYAESVRKADEEIAELRAYLNPTGAA